MKKIVIISSSLRGGSNSEILAKEFEKGAKEAGNNVEFISLKNKKIKFCLGCLSCQKSGKCIIEDDVLEIMSKIKEADILVFATPVYYYGISGQLKTLLDRLNPLYGSNYKFRDIYLISTAAENSELAFEKTIINLQGWIDCFDKAVLKKVIKAAGLEGPKEANSAIEKLKECYELGGNIK